jgi:hypothetical protein
MSMEWLRMGQEDLCCAGFVVAWYDGSWTFEISKHPAAGSRNDVKPSLWGDDRA